MWVAPVSVENAQGIKQGVILNTMWWKELRNVMKYFKYRKML